MNSETEEIKGLCVKAFVGWETQAHRPINTPVATMDEARKMFDDYTAITRR